MKHSIEKNTKQPLVQGQEDDQTTKSRENVQQFLEFMLNKLTPEQADQYLEVRMIGKAQQARTHFLSIDSDVEESLNKLVQQAIKESMNVFVGVALRSNDKSGKEADCSLLPCIVVDYDEFEGVKIKDISDATMRKQIRKKVLRYLAGETEFPPTMIVDSGNGFHAYYSLKQAVDAQEYKEQFVRKAKWLCERYPNLPGDPAMQRLAQPIRLPGSYNVKNPKSPRLCRVLRYQPEHCYDFDDLPEIKVDNTKKHRTKNLPPVKSEKSKYPFWSCRFLEWMRKNPEQQSYNLWMAAASTLAYFGEEGREAFHELSRRYGCYKHTEADAMFNNMLTSKMQGIGPVTYEKLEDYGFSHRDNTDVASPAIYIEHLWETSALSELGFSFDEDGKMSFNPNKFAEGFQKDRSLVIHEGAMFYCYLEGVWKPIPDYSLKRTIRDVIQGVKKDIYRSWMGDQAIEILRLDVPEAKQLDAQKHLINLKNGMLDINNFQLLPHGPDYFSTVQIPLMYESSAQCKRFEQFVSEIMDDDPQRVAVLQEIIGYLLTAETIISKCILLHGSGANGKSLLLDIITQLVGDENVSNLSMKDFENSFRRANLIGKTLNISTENETDAKGFNSQYFKAVVSGDPIMVEEKFKPAVTYRPICKLVFAVNNLPFSPDRSYGFFRRILIIPFDRRFDGKNADKHLRAKLIAELPGILNWALEGLKRLRKQEYEFTPCKAIDEAIAKYEHEQNPIRDFIAEVIVKSPGSRVKRADVMSKYVDWCGENGFGDVVKMSAQKFWSIYKANSSDLGLPCEVQVSNGVRYLKNISISQIGVNGASTNGERRSA